MITMYVDMFVNVVDVLVSTVLSGINVMIYTSVAVVPSSISPQIPGTGGTLEALGLPQILLPLLLVIFSFIKIQYHGCYWMMI